MEAEEMEVEVAEAATAVVAMEAAAPGGATAEVSRVEEALAAKKAAVERGAEAAEVGLVEVMMEGGA